MSAADWKYRRSAAPDDVHEIPAAALLPLLQEGVLAGGHQFLPPGETTWIDAPGAMYRLLVKKPVAAPPPNPPPPPTTQIPQGRPPQGRPPRAAAPVQPPPAPVAPAPVAAPVPPQRSVRDAWHQPPPPAAATPAPQAIPLALPTVAPPAIQTPPPLPTLPPRPAPAGTPQPETDDSARPRYVPLKSGDDEDELDMTPMIDVTFLLLIFFMVASTISQAASIQLPESITGDTEDPKERVILSLEFPPTAAAGDEKRFTGSRPLLMTEAVFTIVGVEAEVPAGELEAKLTEQLRDQNKTQLILQADRKIPAGIIREVLKIANKAGARKTLVGVSVKP